MYTPQTFAQAQEVIQIYRAVVQAREAVIDRLQEACVAHIAQALPYELLVLPPTLEQTAFHFTGFVLEWMTPPYGDEGRYYVYTYEPLRTLQIPDDLPQDLDLGGALPLVCWRGVLWIPAVARAGRLCEECPHIEEPAA
jgi:hypothetical protein